jgi:hypothetical protein
MSPASARVGDKHFIVGDVGLLAVLDDVHAEASSYWRGDEGVDGGGQRLIPHSPSQLPDQPLTSHLCVLLDV